MPLDKRGQTWEETFDAGRSFVFLVLDVVKPTATKAEYYRLLDLETGEIDHVSREGLDNPSESWRRLA